MRRSVGLAIGAAVVSVTIGVLVGVVIHAGLVQRADSQMPPAFSPEQTDSSTMTESESTDLSTPALGAGPTEPSFSVAPTSPVTDPDPTELSSPLPLSQGFGPAEIAPDQTATTPTTGASAPSSATAATSTSTPVTRQSTVTVTSTITSGNTTQTGFNTASESCGTLGAKSSSSDGTTLYCQRDQTDGTLRWRSVSAGGGCLNQSMTGVGPDHATYVCQLGTDGRNHWVAAG